MRSESGRGDDTVVIGLCAVVIGVLAAVVSAIGAGRPSLWVDEAATLSASTRPLRELWSLLGQVDLVHGLYYLLMHGWFAVFPATEFWLRLPSALMVGVAAAGVVVLGDRLSGRAVGVAAGVVLAVLPRATGVGADGRSYALTMACAVWLTVVFVVAVRRGRWWWAGYGVALAVSVLVNVLVLLVITAHAAMLFAMAASRRAVAVWAVTTGVAVTAVAPFVLAVVQQRSQVGWVWPISAVTLGQIFGEQYFPSVYSSGMRVVGPDQQEFTAEQFGVAVQSWARVAPVIVVLAGITAVAVLRRRRVGAPPARTLLWGGGTWVVAPTVLLVLYSLVADPLYQAQYLSFTAPGLALLVGYCVVAAGRTPQRITLLLLIAVAAVPNYIAQRTSYAKFGSDQSEVARLLSTQSRSGECLLVDPDRPPSAVHALEGARLVYRDGLRDVGAAVAQQDSLWSERKDVTARDLRDCATVWIVSETTDNRWPEGFQPVQRWDINQSRVVKAVRAQS
ncbi:glycosyltransferase family 39 protein [Mycobacterium sp. SMC-4]|uniref:glycosyltransferase family 39 protein n=1 Tax=Mycobacterium sp. SMC-4 TaxID=2857059 RepID=UPI003CFF6E13